MRSELERSKQTVEVKRLCNRNDWSSIFRAIAAFSFNPDRGELLNVTKIQLVDSKGNEVAVIDAKGVSL